MQTCRRSQNAKRRPKDTIEATTTRASSKKKHSKAKKKADQQKDRLKVTQEVGKLPW